jgi:tetratricopeptide (TPR) repeat protein
MRNSQQIVAAFLLLLMFVLTAGCASDKNAKAELNEGYAALESRQYDQAIQRADAFLQHTPQGAGSAEALYLRGRSLEQKPVKSQAEMQSNLQAARTTYIEALSHQPPPKLEAYIHTSLANVAYHQDDYTTAINEWTGAYDKLDDNDVKSWVLYRVGLCRQRLGQFADADSVFAAVQERYPNSEPAQRAKAHQGARGFSVQLATFANAQAADSAVTAVRRDGVPVARQADAQGRSIVLVGPYPSYQQAVQTKARYAARYPDAVIVP